MRINVVWRNTSWKIKQALPSFYSSPTVFQPSLLQESSYLFLIILHWVVRVLWSKHCAFIALDILTNGCSRVFLHLSDCVCHLSSNKYKTITQKEKITCSNPEILAAWGSSTTEEAEPSGYLEGPLNNEWFYCICYFPICLFCSPQRGGLVILIFEHLTLNNGCQCVLEWYSNICLQIFL